MQKIKKGIEEVWGPGYHAFELLDDSMFDGTRRSLIKGDLLKCREIENEDRLGDMSSLKCAVVIVTLDRVLVGNISQQDDNTVFLSKYNPAFQGEIIDLDTVESIYRVESFQRSIPRRVKAKKPQTNPMKTPSLIPVL